MSEKDTTLSPLSLLAVAKLAAQRAAHHALSQRERRGEAKMVARHDVKLVLDVECQDIATKVILQSFPGHHVLGEEDEESKILNPKSKTDYEWIIDPIDGTVNFFHGNPYWCCSVAVRRGSEVLAGCVCAPEMNLVFEATCDSPALRNGIPIRVSATSRLDRANVHTGADKATMQKHGEGTMTLQPFRFFSAIALAAQRPRIFGAAALDICLVAAGSADAFFEPGLYIWDTAAADLILRQAGGTSALLRHHSPIRFAYLGSNGHLQRPLEEIVTPLLADV